MKSLFLVPALGALVSLALGDPAALAGGLENGDFTKGKAKWLGSADIVFLKPDGTISPTDDSKTASALPSATPGGAADKPKSTPIAEFKLHNGQFAELSQRFKTDKGENILNVEVVFKASPDFKLNDKAPVFTRGNTWAPGTTWYWSALAFPKVDLCLRLDKHDGHSYKCEAVKPGEDWKTIKFRRDNVGENQDVSFSALAAPGKGTLWVKSITVTGPNGEEKPAPPK